MFCYNCGANISDGMKFCPACGSASVGKKANQPQPPVQKAVPVSNYNSAQTEKTDKFELIKLILSLIITVIIIIATFGGYFVLIGTNSSIALLVVMFGVLGWEIYKLYKYFKK